MCHQVFCLHVSMCAMHVPAAQGGQKRVPDHLELSCESIPVLRTQPQSPRRSARALNHRAISPTLLPYQIFNPLSTPWRRLLWNNHKRCTWRTRKHRKTPASPQINTFGSCTVKVNLWVTVIATFTSGPLWPSAFIMNGWWRPWEHALKLRSVGVWKARLTWAGEASSLRRLWRPLV